MARQEDEKQSGLIEVEDAGKATQYILSLFLCMEFQNR
jgi:hypothetical protein